MQLRQVKAHLSPCEPCCAKHNQVVLTLCHGGLSVFCCRAVAAQREWIAMTSSESRLAGCNRFL